MDRLGPARSSAGDARGRGRTGGPGDEFGRRACRTDPHFGLLLSTEGFHELAARLREAGTGFLIEPYLRFPGEPAEQWTMFLLDPCGNALEFKAFRDESKVFTP